MKRVLLIGLMALPLTAQASTPEQRGFQVYRQVCATCHSLDHVTFADLSGIGLAVADIKAYAASHQVPDGVDDDGDPKTRPARLSDSIGSPYPSEAMARLANHGDTPPDFSRLAMTEEGAPGGSRRSCVLMSPSRLASSSLQGLITIQLSLRSISGCRRRFMTVR